MGRARQAPQRQDTQLSGAAEEIAVILISGAAAQVMVSRIAPLLLVVMPPPLLAFPTLAGSVATRVAGLIVQDADRLAVDGDRLVRRAQIDNLLYRALYGIKALRRVGGAALKGGEEALEEALRKEQRYFRAHKDVSKRRIASAESIEGLMALYGPVLSWNHEVTRKPIEPRPSHRAADGSNFRPLNGPPRRTGAYPGVLSYCSCAAGPPAQGARIIR